MAYKDFTQLSVWRDGLRLLILVYSVTKNFPNDERFGLVSDMRRSANSFIHNIAEGFGRFEKRDKTRFYKISRGSAFEIISQTHASNALGYICTDEKEELIFSYREVIYELDKLIKAVESR